MNTIQLQITLLSQQNASIEIQLYTHTHKHIHIYTHIYIYGHVWYGFILRPTGIFELKTSANRHFSAFSKHAWPKGQATFPWHL